MSQDHNIAVFDWFSDQFTIEGRAGFVEQVRPLLESLIQPGSRVLDLCCGAGGVTFILEEMGARITAIDLAPGLIDIAREEAASRGSSVDFVLGDVLTYPLGDGAYDLVSCFGNAVLDFPPRTFPGFRDRVHRALKPEGHFAFQYRDGVLRLMAMSDPPKVIEHGAKGRIERRFLRYDPERGAFLAHYRHLATGECHECVGYVYTGPLLRAMLAPAFKLERSLRLGELSFIDNYQRL
jgi:SAM-dependent methyltransferase